MTKLAPTLIALLVAAGCGGGGKTGKPPGKPDPAPTHGEIPCTSELALACAEGAADGCLDGKTTFHACVPTAETAGPACEMEIAKVCGEGQVDACLTTPVLSTQHVCVFPNATKAAAPSCPEGQGFYAPGCGTGAPAITEGCYAACSGGEACAAGFACKTVTTDPCHNSMCDACGAETELCMPSA